MKVSHSHILIRLAVMLMPCVMFQFLFKNMIAAQN